MNGPHSLNWLPAALEGLADAGLRRERRVRSGLAGDVLDFGSNDYLGLAGDPRIAAAAAGAAQGYGWGSGASPVVSGRTPPLAALEDRIARFEGTEAALVFSSGFAANAGAIPALVDEGDVLYADAKNHASLIDGCRLSRAERHIYPHSDLDRLAEQLDQDQGRYRRRLIATDGLFSMDGDFAPLAGLAELAERHDAMLLVDEAHATAVWGATGRGSVQRAAADDPHVEARVAVRIGTLSKALGGVGGFIAGSRDLIDWLYNRARPYVFSTAPPPAAAAAAIAAIETVESEPWRRAQATANAERLRERLQVAGWDTGDSASQIVPIRVGHADQAMKLAHRLAEKGLYVPAIRPPSVPVGESLLRVSVSARHTADDLDRLLGTLGERAQVA